MTEEERKERIREFELNLGDEIPLDLRRTIIAYESETGDEIKISDLIAVMTSAKKRDYLNFEKLIAESRAERYAELIIILGVSLTQLVAKTESLEIQIEEWVYQLQKEVLQQK